MTATTNGTGGPTGPVLGLTTAAGFVDGDLTSPARAAAQGALVDTNSTHQVTELRIHGVSGSNGPTMLEHPQSVQVAGDAVAGFHRRWTPAGQGGATVPWRLEAYSWGGLTEAKLASASWILLAPFMLYNVAHYMLPVRDGRERRHRLADAMLRLLALTATLQLVIATLGALLDVLALQVGVPRLPPGAPAWLQGALASAALLGVLAVIGLLWYIGIRTANSYEARSTAPAATRPLAPTPGSTAPAPPSDEPRWPLADPAFWRGKRLVDRQRTVHTVAAFAVVAIVAAVAGRGGGWHLLCLVLGVLALLGAVVMTCTTAVSRYEVSHEQAAEDLGRPGTGEPGAGGCDEEAAAPPVAHRGLGAVVSAAVATAARAVVCERPRRKVTLWVAAAVALLAILVDLADATWAGRPDVTAELTTAWACLALTQVVLLGVLALAVWSLRPAPSTAVDAPPGPYLRGHLSTVVAALAVLLGGLLSAVVTIAATRAFGNPRPTGPSQAAAQAVATPIAVPWPLYAFAAVLLGFLVAGLAAGVGLLVMFGRRRTAHLFTVTRRYRAARPVYRKDRERVAGAWAQGDLADAAGRVLLAVTLAGVACAAVAALLLRTSALDGVVTWLFALLHLGSVPVGSLVEGSVSVVTVLALLVAGWLVNLLRTAYGDSAKRRTIGIVWDVGTFWPRAAHPFAPPCYAERAVPEVVDRITALTGHLSAQDADTRPGPGPRIDPAPLTLTRSRVLLTGYSQGSIIAPAAVGQLKEEVRDEVALLTLACPARRLYGRAFPAFFGPAYLEKLGTSLTPTGAAGPRWTNAVRHSDYIGSWVGRGPDIEESTGPLGAIDVWCDDPVAVVGVDCLPAPIHRHSSWWPDPQVGVLAEKLVQLLSPPAARPRRAGVPAAPLPPTDDQHAEGGNGLHPEQRDADAGEAEVRHEQPRGAEDRDGDGGGQADQHALAPLHAGGADGRPDDHVG